jgi:hypothetical protein
MEMMVVLAIVTVVFLASFSLLQDAVDTSLFVEEHNDLPIFAQGAVNAIQREMLQAQTVFDGTAGSIGPGYFTAMQPQLPATDAIFKNFKQPVANSTGTLVPDDPAAAQQYTGNCLLIVRQLDPAAVTISTGTLLVDRYVFELFYLTQRQNHGFSTSNYYLDVVLAKSDIYADYNQVFNWQSTKPTLADMQAVNTALPKYVDARTGLPQPMKRAWNPGQSAATAFYDIISDGTFKPVANPTIKVASTTSLIKPLRGGRVSGRMDYSVAFRPSSTASFPIREAIPKYAAFTASQPEFPSGLEFLIVGPAGSRRILARVVIMASYGLKYDSREATVITSAS